MELGTPLPLKVGGIWWFRSPPPPPSPTPPTPARHCSHNHVRSAGRPAPDSSGLGGSGSASCRTERGKNHVSRGWFLFHFFLDHRSFQKPDLFHLFFLLFRWFAEKIRIPGKNGEGTPRMLTFPWLLLLLTWRWLFHVPLIGRPKVHPQRFGVPLLSPAVFLQPLFGMRIPPSANWWLSLVSAVSNRIWPVAIN